MPLSMRRRVQVWLGGAALFTAALSGLVLIAAIPGLAETQDIALDRQAYVPDAGPDAYTANAAAFGGCTGSPPCPDPNDLHIGAAPQQSTYHALLHIELGAIPEDDTVGSLKSPWR